MRTLVFTVIMVLLGSVSAWPRDLGTAGPFHSIGGGSCPVATPDACKPPAVDSALPRPQQVRAHVARALALLDLVSVTDARAALDEALQLDPDDIEALTLRGRLALTNGDPATAEIDIDHALYLKPKDPDLLATRGLMLMSFCNCDQGLADLNAAIAVKPDDPDALFIRARLYLLIRDTGRAFTDLSALLSIAPDYKNARFLRAGLQLLRKDYALAALDADTILHTDPLNTEALQIRATARAGLGDDMGAIESYSAILDDANGSKMLMMPQFRAAMLERARLYAKHKRSADASRDIGTILDQGGRPAVLRLQIFLNGHGFPNVEVTGERSAAFDTAVATCFADDVCGPKLKP